MNSAAKVEENIDPPRRGLMERLHRTGRDLERHRAKYERACEERDAARHERDAYQRRVGELEQQVAALEAEVTRLTDENVALRKTPLEVSGPARHAS